MSGGLRITAAGGVVNMALSRPEVKNAFDADLIAGLTAALREYAERDDTRALVLSADGPMFCAGADFNWMRSQREASVETNIHDAQALYDMFYELYDFPHPTIARVQGGAYGGGVGLVACCDFVVMATDALLAFSEVKIGLVPATISPFVIRKIGEGQARELFLTGAIISAAQALSAGLASIVVPVEGLDAAVEEYLGRLSSCGPGALRATKELLREVPRLSLFDAREFTAERIARQRVSSEAQEGMTAFLEKRKPSWTGK
jgi:methylglutaconyl-CoA hydratase